MIGMYSRHFAVAVAMLAAAVESPLAAQHVATTQRAESGEVDLFAQTVSLDVDGATVKSAIEALAKSSKVRITYQSELLDGIAKRVTVHAKDATLGVVLAQILSGTGLQAEFVTRNALNIWPVDNTVVATGSISGVVTEAHGKRPLSGVKITLDSNSRGVTTSSAGEFRLTGIAVGTHTVHAKLIGFKRATQKIVVEDNAAAIANFVLETSATTLDQVVVTGTVVATELKAVPNAITVITAKQIEERGITRIDQLFRGDVPGLFAQNTNSQEKLDAVTMFSRGATTLGSSVNTFNGTNPIKTYVDGIEMADPRYLSQIDPRNIERIEILTGPQASTIYGSNALNGVMQIFTKRGTETHPQLTLNLLSGLIQNNFSDAHTPQHDYNAQVAGVEGRISYSADASWFYMGPWTPSKQTTRVNASGAVRFASPTPVGNLTVDASLRQANTRTNKNGPTEQSARSLHDNGYSNDTGNYFDNFSAIDRLSSQAVGLTFGYAPTSWWSHELSLGKDVSNEQDDRTTRAYEAPWDTTLQVFEPTLDRRSLRYSTTARVPVTSIAQATMTLGADTWQSLQTNTFAYPMVQNGGFQANVYRHPEHNTGAFFQGQLGFLDKVFLTYGLRAEWNPNFGKDASPSYSPRYGIAYTTDIGPVTAKLRASYGRSTRPPAADQKVAQPSTDNELMATYGRYDTQLANPDLGPEFQQGGEGGIELYLGSRASLVVTRYNQTIDALVTPILGADSVRSLLPDPKFFGGNFTCAQIIAFNLPDFCSSQDAQGYGYAEQRQNLNVAGLRNQGWELQGTITTGPITTRGTYSWTKSRSMGVTAKYTPAIAALLRDQPQYIKGATFMFLPEHTWALGMTYAQSRATVALSISGVASLRNYTDEFFIQHLEPRIRLQENRYNFRDGNASSYYVSFSSDYALADLTASYRFTRSVEGVLGIQNLGNFYTQDNDARVAALGRQSKAGFRIRL